VRTDLRRHPLAALALAVALAAASADATAQDAASGGALAISGSIYGSFSAWQDRGSPIVPKGSADSFSGLAATQVRAEAGERSRCAAEGAVTVDAITGKLSFVARELWAEWRPADLVSLRLGRQRLGFGSGLGWNPSNDFDVRRDPSDPDAPRTGVDAAQLRLEAGGMTGFPFSLSVVALTPASGEGFEDARLGAQLYAYLGELELMLVASGSRIGLSDAPWLAGGWATAPLGPLVLGIEGAFRRRPDRLIPGSGGVPVAESGVFGALAATATLRSGDFVAIGEVYWDQASYSREEFREMLASPAPAAWAASVAAPGSVGPLHLLARITWASGDLSASAGAVADLESGAFLATGEVVAATGGAASASLKVTAPAVESALADDELGVSGRGWAARALVTVYF